MLRLSIITTATPAADDKCQVQVQRGETAFVFERQTAFGFEKRDRLRLREARQIDFKFKCQVSNSSSSVKFKSNSPKQDRSIKYPVRG